MNPGDLPPRCLDCRYDLSATSSARCPECGWIIDPRWLYLTDTQAAVRRSEQAVERLARPLHAPAPPSRFRRLLAWYAAAMVLMVISMLVIGLVIGSLGG